MKKIFVKTKSGLEFAGEIRDDQDWEQAIDSDFMWDDEVFIKLTMNGRVTLIPRAQIEVIVAEE